MNRPAYMEVATVQAMIAARDKEEEEQRVKAAAALAYHQAGRTRKHQEKVDILLPIKRAWRYFLKQEERARVAFIKEFYPEATGADLARANFYKELLFWFGTALVTAPLVAGLAAIL